MTFSAVSIFTKNLLNNYKTLGEIAPYSQFTTRKIIKYGKINSSKRILEVGPGLGKFTREILKNCSPDSEIVAVEKLEEFVLYLNQNLKDPRFHLIQGDILDNNVLSKLEPNSFDSIISSIPISFLEKEQRTEYAKIVKSLLKPDGVFINAQYSTSSGKYFKKEGMKCDWKLELRNLPPTFIFRCSRD